MPPSLGRCARRDTNRMPLSAQPCDFLHFLGRNELRDAKKGLEADAEAGERVRSALLPVDDAERRTHLQTGLAQDINRVHEGAAGGDDVLDDADALPRLELPFDSVRRAVALGLVADDHEGQALFE